MSHLNDTIILTVEEEEGERVEVSPVDLYQWAQAVERLFSTLASQRNASIATTLLIVGARMGSVEFHFHSHVHIPPNPQPMAEPPKLADLTTIGANIFSVMVALLLSSSTPGVQQPAGKPVQEPAKLGKEHAYPGLDTQIDAVIAAAAKLGSRVTIQVPDAPTVEIASAAVPGGIASRPRTPLPAHLRQMPGTRAVGGHLTVADQTLRVMFNGSERDARLATMRIVNGATEHPHLVVVIWSSKATPRPGHEVTARGSLVHPSDATPLETVPVAFRRADAIINISEIHDWM